MVGAILFSKQISKSISSIISIRSRFSSQAINISKQIQSRNSIISKLSFISRNEKKIPSFTLFTQSNRTLHITNNLWNEVKVVTCPAFAESITEGDISWIKEEGEQVEEDEVIAEIETDKTTVPLPSPFNGTLENILVQNGSKVNPGVEVCKIKVGATSSKSTISEPKTDQVTPEAPKNVSSSIPTQPPPVPEIPTQPISSKPTPTVKLPPVATADSSNSTGKRTESRIKMSRMRQKISQRLKEAQNTCAMLTTFNEIDMTNIMELRKSYQDSFTKKHQIKLGFMSAFIKASAYALQEQPIVNAVIEGNEIVYRDFVDISVAVASPKGLVVPVLRNVEQMSFAHIEKELVELGNKAKASTLAIEDMDGGTFTISNGGVFGSMFGTPIINPPQSAILGMHAIFQRPVGINGKVEIRPMMYIALTYDHRLVDGREAVTFLKKIKSAVEDPRIMFLEL